MKWWKFLLILFVIVLLYRLLKNIFRCLRANYYINTAYEGDFLKSPEFRSAVESILTEANMYAYEATRYNLFIARGKFKRNILDNFSIFFWVDTILYLPVNVLTYLGVGRKKQNKISSTILSLLWWLFTFVISLFSDEIKAFIVSVFKSIQV